MGSRYPQSFPQRRRAPGSARATAALEAPAGQEHGAGRTSALEAEGCFAGAGLDGEGYGGFTNRDIAFDGPEGGPESGMRQRARLSGGSNRQPAFPHADIGRWPRGPRNFSPSDERLRERVCERLMRMQELDVSEVSVAVSDACVTLEGKVPERSMKDAIAGAANDCRGVSDVINHIRVVPRAGPLVAGGQGAGMAGAGHRLAAEVARGQRKG
ncbi:BON domain-containing protein [Azoarcus sp. TTM-91]|uniref:BON domain-containing protein n=1 Tax=Azoarcus sp. TTM-91 TaxID=2691581 RepID=UPI00145C98D2|nr:BON domain-containing protein [Azoarcus sp. TTM-91]NMG35153.1 BON domain-containing protein [Azoarcus sp. TTM-91]